MKNNSKKSGRPTVAKCHPQENVHLDTRSGKSSGSMPSGLLNTTTESNLRPTVMCITCMHDGFCELQEVGVIGEVTIRVPFLRFFTRKKKVYYWRPVTGCADGELRPNLRHVEYPGKLN